MFSLTKPEMLWAISVLMSCLDSSDFIRSSISGKTPLPASTRSFTISASPITPVNDETIRVAIAPASRRPICATIRAIIRRVMTSNSPPMASLPLKHQIARGDARCAGLRGDAERGLVLLHKALCNGAAVARFQRQAHA